MPTDPWPATVARVRRLEEMGYDHLWVYDHLSWQRYQDRAWMGTYTWLAGLAAVTSRIGLGTMVANPNIRHPLTLAKDAITIDQISDGRMILGIGAGGTGFDARILGQWPLSAKERTDRLIEHVHLLDGLLRGTMQDHTGEHYEVRHHAPALGEQTDEYLLANGFSAAEVADLRAAGVLGGAVKN